MAESESPSSEQPNETPSNSTNNPPEESGSTENQTIASSITTSTTIGDDLQIDVYSLERLDNDLLRLRVGVTNNSPDPFNLGFGLSDSNAPRSASKVSLIDEVKQQRYLSHTKDGGECFCNEVQGDISSGDTEALWVIFPEPPDGLEKMTLLTPLTPPIFDVPISSSSDIEEYSELGESQILNLTTITDSLDGDQSGRTEDHNEVSILLSSDVLFDTNSSQLNSDTQEILEQVAQEIDDASASVISIDGHADNTGSDTVNIPLSKDRAESVESALSNLVTREGVDFKVEGLGSSDPIADNQTEEGRERNRRVSVTFEK